MPRRPTSPGRVSFAVVLSPWTGKDVETTLGLAPSTRIRRVWCSITDSSRPAGAPAPRAQDQDLGVLVPVAHGKKTQDRERVHRRQVGQSHQPSRTSCRDDRVAVAVPAPYRATKSRPGPTDPTPLTCTDEFSARSARSAALWQPPRRRRPGVRGGRRRHQGPGAERGPQRGLDVPLDARLGRAAVLFARNGFIRSPV